MRLLCLRDAIHEFFSQRAQAYRRRLRELFRVGRTSLVIGLVAVASAIALGDFLAALMKGSRIGEIVRESLTIGGWVSMWRPLEIFLYDWWPIRNEARQKIDRNFIRSSSTTGIATEGGRSPTPYSSRPNSITCVFFCARQETQEEGAMLGCVYVSSVHANCRVTPRLPHVPVNP